MARGRWLWFVVLDADPWGRWWSYRRRWNARRLAAVRLFLDIVPLSMERWAATGCERSTPLATLSPSTAA